MNQPSPAPQELQPDKVGAVILCLFQSFLACVAFSFVGIVIASIVVFSRSQHPPHGGILFVGIFTSIVGSLLGCWLPAWLCWFNSGSKWALIAGAACVGLVNACFFYPEVLNSIQSLG